MKGQQKNMNELYLIMEDLLEVEYQQKALLSILNALESVYSENETAPTKYLISSVCARSSYVL